MGTRENVTQGGSAHDVTVASGVGHLVREIGMATRDDFEAERTARSVDRRLQPRRHGTDVDSGDLLVARAHHRYGTCTRSDTGHPRPSRPSRPDGGGDIVISMSGTAIVDVTDATFEIEVVAASRSVPVIVDLWAPWCGPCKTLTPVLEKVVQAAGGRVKMAKVNIDENPGIAQAFRVQSIPMVVAIRDGAPVTGFQGAQPEHIVQQFIDELLPTQHQEHIAALLARGDEASLWAVLEIEPGNESAVVGLAHILTERGEGSEALALLGRVPETDDVRKAAAAARMSMRAPDDYDHQLGLLLDVVKADDGARQQFLDILELMGPDDPRTAQWRKKLTARLY